MKKKLICLIILTVSLINPLFSSEIPILWGISQADLICKLKLQNYTTFKPEEKPEYSNRIITFFNSMDSEDKAVITILRSQGTPGTDYCFFNEKLYSIVEDWGSVNKTKAYDILLNLKGTYELISTEEKKSDSLYSFKKDRTKVMLSKKVIDDKTARVKVFYYSLDLFKILLGQ